MLSGIANAIPRRAGPIHRECLVKPGVEKRRGAIATPTLSGKKTRLPGPE
ncbi:hypothetical protein K3163_11980 [Qipengyuania sp. 1NDW9]|nr:hypothetical protein [Qipengyuania xiapuensis]MBX7493925.1 hypothetical protein [Qipengyuania xiapuensis]